MKHKFKPGAIVSVYGQIGFYEIARSGLMFHKNYSKEYVENSLKANPTYFKNHTYGFSEIGKIFDFGFRMNAFEKQLTLV